MDPNNSAGTSSSNQLQRRGSINANTVRGLQALGNLASINPTSRMLPSIPLSSSYLQHPMMSASNSFNSGPPPLPPRRSATSSYNRVPSMGMNNYYSPYSRYSTGMYSPGYRGYGGMSPYGHYGGPADVNNSFIQMAEESTRPAFESIESVVQVVSSISMMLESTYHAVHSSYSAILGVVDQFSRLKDHLAQILSILALLRGLRWLCLKVLYILRLRKDNPSDEAAWSSAELVAGNLSSSDLPGQAQGSAWPFLMFVGLVIGAPWLMFKLLSKTVDKKPFDLNLFKDENGKRYSATAAYDFKATQRGELSFYAGEKLYLAPTSYRTSPKGWVYACNSRQETGLIPSNYLMVKGKSPVRNTRNIIPQFQPNAAVPEENIDIPDQIVSQSDSFGGPSCSVKTSENSATRPVDMEPDALADIRNPNAMDENKE